ncbi:MAG: hypothetical protein ACRYFR_11170 [Janthinobacterium lividum]
MIIYGTNGAHLHTAPLPGLACPACAAPEALQLTVFSRYVHIYWVPLLPYSRPAVAQCLHCQQAWDEKTLPAAVRPAVQSFKKQFRAPVWHWTGALLAAVGLLWGIVASSRDDKANAAYLAAPRAGDIYTVHEKAGDPNYSLLKVVSAGGNLVELVANEYQVNNSHPIDDLNAPAKYSKESFSLTLLDLRAMQNKGQLTDVDRPAQ